MGEPTSSILIPSGNMFETETLEAMRACRRAKFPLCLEHALEKVFSNKEMIASVAKKAGFKSRPLSTHHDVMQAYIDFLSSLQKALGSDSVAVLENATLEEIESMKCIDCPINRLELQRKSDKYSKPLPVTPEEISY